MGYGDGQDGQERSRKTDRLRRMVGVRRHAGHAGFMPTDEHYRVRVEPDALFVEDGNLWTSAGTAAGIDLCLHLVRAAHGAEAAATIARSMVTAPFRAGSQAQFIEHPTAHAHRDADALAEVRAFALTHLHEPLTVSSLAAREVIVGTLGTIYGMESEGDTSGLQAALQRDLSFAGAVALLVFFAFAMQCMSTLAVVRRETGGWKWPAIQFLYMSGMAYVCAFLTYQVLS